MLISLTTELMLIFFIIFILFLNYPILPSQANHAVPDTQPFYFGTEVLSTFVPNFVAK